MLRTRYLLLVPLTLIILLLGSSSCSDVLSDFLNDDAEAVPRPPSLSLDDAALAEAMRSALETPGPAQQRLRAQCSGFDTLAQFYRTRGYATLWLDEDGTTPRFAGVWPFLSGSAAHGIYPARYHVWTVEALLASLTDEDPKRRHAAAAEAEILLSDAVLRYAYDLRFGLVNPKQLEADKYHLPVAPRPRGAWLQPLQQDDIPAFLASVQPAEQRYRELSEALLRHLRLAREHRWPVIHDPGVDKLEPGDTSSVLAAVARRLMLSGVFGDGPPALPPAISALERSIALADLWGDAYYHQRALFYDSTLVHAVMRFQERKGLLVDGIIGERTVAELNTGAEDMVRTAALNLERFRWMRYPEKGRYVRVNIPEFRLYAFDDGEVKATMAVCVGQRRSPYYHEQLRRYERTRIRAHRPKDHETPQITGSFKHFILNPFWHVPHSIGADELYYDAKRDSSFLRRKGYRVYYRDSLVMPEEINWTKYSPSNMPFRFKQEPGGGNALGRIKFPFDNDFSIYLHDTPMRMPFRRSIRAVSHGCVRIEEPMVFAKYLLDGMPDWDVAKVQRLIWSGQRSKVVYLKNITPVFLDYYTAWVDDDGVLQLRGDIYRKDAMLTRALERRHPDALFP